MAVVDISNTYKLTNVGAHIDNTDVYNSNRNLLDNPWFRIDQRSVSGTITSGYIADRWTITYGSGGVQASRTDNSVTVKSTSGSSHGDIAQKMEKSLFDFLVGKIVTASVMRSDGSVISKSFTFQSRVGSIDVGTDLDGNAISVRVYQASTYQDVQFWKWKTAGTFRAVKLELGSYSTLANDVPPDYGEELRKCQRYFVRIASSVTAFPVGFGVKDSATIADIFVPTPVEMRVTPSTSKSGVHRVWGGNAASRDVSSYSTVAKTTTGVYLRATIASGSLADYYTYVLYLQNGAYIDLSADL